MKKLCILGYPKCAKLRFSSYCENAQADLNVRWATWSKVRFLTLRRYVFRMYDDRLATCDLLFKRDHCKMDLLLELMDMSFKVIYYIVLTLRE